MKARVIGVEHQFKTFQFFFPVFLGNLLLKHSDNLSKTLQSQKMSASEGQHVASMTVTTLQSLRNNDNFALFWQKIEIIKKDLDIEDPKLPRKRKVPRRYEDGNGEAKFDTDVKAYYKKIYYEVLDLIINCIQSRFDQEGYQIYRNLQDLLLKAVRKESYEDCFKIITSFYTDDLDPSQLRLHLETLSANFNTGTGSSVTIFDIKDYVLSLSVYERPLISEVVTILKLILVLPSTNAMSERSFSALRRIKNYLRSTMLQSRLNHLLLLHVHKDLTDSLELVSVTND